MTPGLETVLFVIIPVALNAPFPEIVPCATPEYVDVDDPGTYMLILVAEDSLSVIAKKLYPFSSATSAHLRIAKSFARDTDV